MNICKKTAAAIIDHTALTQTLLHFEAKTRIDMEQIAELDKIQSNNPHHFWCLEIRIMSSKMTTFIMQVKVSQ